MTKVLEKIDPKKVLRHCENLGLSEMILAECLAIHPKSIQRWREGSAAPNESTLRSLEKLEQICSLAAKLLKKESGPLWFSSPNLTLGGERPVDLLRQGEMERVKNVLGMIAWGIYS